MPREISQRISLPREISQGDQRSGFNRGAAHFTGVKTLTSGPINWETFLHLVDRHRVPALVYRGMGKVTDNGIPQDVHRDLRERFERNTRKALAAEMEVRN